MPFKPGQSGNPSGRPKGALSFRTAIEQALKRRSQGKDALALVKIADRLLDMALNGDMKAIREIGDRLDGRPTQVSEVQVHDPLAEMSVEDIIKLRDELIEARDRLVLT